MECIILYSSGNKTATATATATATTAIMYILAAKMKILGGERPTPKVTWSATATYDANLL